MGLTSFYALPFPDDLSTVDVPRDIEALAQKLELWKNGFTVPSGEIVTGDPAQTASRGYRIKRLVGGSVYEVTLSCGGATAILTTFLNSVTQSNMALNQAGQVIVTVGANARPLPFASSMGNSTANFTNASAGSGTAVFKNGLFTETPYIVTASGGSYYNATPAAVTLTQATITVRHIDATLGNGPISSFVWAVQMLPTASPGPTLRAEDEYVYTRVATCRTQGCDNEGIPIDIIHPDSTVTCQPCGIIIEDVRPI